MKKITIIREKWTPEEDERIIRLYPKMTCRQLLQFFPNRTLYALKKRTEDLRKMGKLPYKRKVKIYDTKKFAEMWNSDVPRKDIAKEFGISVRYLFVVRRKLQLPPRQRGWAKYAKAKGQQSEQRVLEYLEKSNGICRKDKLELLFPTAAIRRLVYNKRIFKVTFNLGRSTGSYKRNILYLLFKKPYALRTFICLNRTAVVRLMCAVLKRPRTSEIKRTMTAFLREYLTEAEKIAVRWNLGERKWTRDRVKSSIQIDDIIRPKKEKEGLKSRRKQFNEESGK